MTLSGGVHPGPQVMPSGADVCGVCPGRTSPGWCRSAPHSWSFPRQHLWRAPVCQREALSGCRRSKRREDLSPLLGGDGPMRWGRGPRSPVMNIPTGVFILP